MGTPRDFEFAICFASTEQLALIRFSAHLAQQGMAITGEHLGPSTTKGQITATNIHLQTRLAVERGWLIFRY